MTLDTRTDAERRYDAERDGSLYVKPEPEITDADRALARQWDAIVDHANGAEPSPVPFGTLADGTPILGTFDGTRQGGWHRVDCVTIETDLWSFTVDGSGGVAGGTADDDTIYVEDITIAQLLELRDFLNSGALERMQVAAVAWGRGDAEPPATTDDMAEEFVALARKALRLAAQHRPAA